MTSTKELTLQTEPMMAVRRSLLQVVRQTLLKSNSDYMSYRSI